MALIKLTEKFTGDIILIDPETITKVANRPQQILNMIDL